MRCVTLWVERMREADAAFHRGEPGAAAAVLLEMYQLTGPMYVGQTYHIRNARQSLARAVDLARDGVMQRAESHYRAAIVCISGERRSETAEPPGRLSPDPDAAGQQELLREVQFGTGDGLSTSVADSPLRPFEMSQVDERTAC